MGLYARVDLSQFEESANSLAGMISNFVVEMFDSLMEDIDSGTGEEEGGVQWDGMEGADCDFSGSGSAVADAFSEAFMENARSLVPVRTGYLQSTIDCHAGSEVECFAGADYAQYVEYGTSKMSAQPYFEPAIEAGLEAARIAGQDEIDKMASEFEDAITASIDDGVAGIDGFSIVGLIAAMIVAMILYALIEALVDWFIDELTGALDNALEDVDIYIM